MVDYETRIHEVYCLFVGSVNITTNNNDGNDSGLTVSAAESVLGK